MRAARGPAPTEGSSFSDFLEWAAPGSLPFPDETEIAIRAWLDLDADEDAGVAPGI